jgi:MoaA/NifB/PqqE/SkfB family radical SAM enzyme
MNRDTENELTTEQKRKILSDFAQWYTREKCCGDLANENLCVWFTGGEPFLKAEEVLELAEECQNDSLKCGLNTNGTLLWPNISEILGSGLRYVEFSFDSHIEKIHDLLRGVKGTYERAKESLERMLSERKTMPTVYVHTILGSWNLDCIDDMIEWTEGLGVDGIGFQPLQCPFGDIANAEWHENFPYFPTKQQINTGLARLLEMKEGRNHILNSANEISSWYTYFNNPFLLPPGFKPCKAMFQNIIVDCLGNVRFCFNKEIDPLGKIGNLCKESFDDVWKGRNAKSIREEMLLCRRSCGIMSCHRDVNM